MDNNNLFSIGEIAKAVGITRKIILNYETKGLITPDKKRRHYGQQILHYRHIHANLPEDISYCVAVPQGSEGEYVRIIPELKAISFFHHGAYEEIPKARERLISYAEENNIKLSGVFRNLYIEGPPQHKDKSKFITQITAVIEEK